MDNGEVKHANRDLIDGLRALADFLEAHPQDRHASVTLNLYPQSKEDFLSRLRGVGGIQKRVLDRWFYASKDFGPMVKLEWNRPREEICERVVTGKRTVEKPVMQQIGVETVEEDVVAWKCPDSIFRPEEVTAQ